MNIKLKGGVLNSSEESELNNFKNSIFDNSVLPLLYHKFGVQTLQQIQKKQLESDLNTNIQKALTLWNKKQLSDKGPAPSQVPFDFNKLKSFDLVQPTKPYLPPGAFVKGNKFYIMANLKEDTPLYNTILQIQKQKDIPPKIKSLHMTLLELETNNEAELFKHTTQNAGQKNINLNTSIYCQNIANYTDKFAKSFSQNIGSQKMKYKDIVSLPQTQPRFNAFEYEMDDLAKITSFRKDFYEAIEDILRTNGIINQNLVPVGHSGDDRGYVYFGKNKNDNRDQCLYAVRKFYFGQNVINSHISVTDYNLNSNSSDVLQKRKEVEDYIKLNKKDLNLDIKPNYFNELHISFSPCEKKVNIPVAHIIPIIPVPIKPLNIKGKKKCNNLTINIVEAEITDGIHDGTIILDPAGTAFHTNSFENCSGVSGALYKTAKHRGTLLEKKNVTDVMDYNSEQDVKNRTKAKFVKYDNFGIIHVVSQNFGMGNWNTNSIKSELTKSYNQVYNEVQHLISQGVNLSDLRFVVLSGGIFSGNYDNTIFDNTINIICQVFNNIQTPITINLYNNVVSQISILVNSITKQNKLSVLSYNISWEAMNANNPTDTKFHNGYDASKCRNTGWANIPKQKWKNNKCFDNVINYINNKNADIIALQEAGTWDAIQTKINNQYSPIHHHSPPPNPGLPVGPKNWPGEDIVTFYNQQKLLLIRHIGSDFDDPGRPYQIIEFKDYATQKIIIFANVHCGHNSNHCISNNQRFKTDLNNIITQNNDLHIIIAGDHNVNYLSGPTINKIKFHRDTSTKQTCCDTSGNGTKFDYKMDWLLYNKNKIQSVSEQINVMASDHLPVYGEITL